MESPLLVFDVCLISPKIRQTFIGNDIDGVFALRKGIAGLLKSLPDFCLLPLPFPCDLWLLGVSACPLLFS